MKTHDDKKGTLSFDDLVFEKRNKEYGAYIMRKKYNAAILWSIVVSAFFISATVVTPFVIYEKPPIVEPPPIDSSMVEFDKTILKIHVTNPEPPKPFVEKIPKLDYSKPEIVDSLSDDDAKKFLPNEDRNDKIKNDSVIDFVPTSDPIDIDPDLNNSINDIFKVNEKPYFGIGGDNEFRSWISKNIIYPEAAKETNTQGRVYLQFVVEKDGSLSNIQAVNLIDPILSKEAIRVLKLSPKWNPGKINGTPVRVRYSFPITFTLSGI